MDWSAEPPTPSTSSLFPQSRPFMFDSASLMQVDPTSPVPSTSKNNGENDQVQDAPLRDIAAGGVQRERRKRDKLKEWQVVPKSGLSTSATLSETSEDEDNLDDTTLESQGIISHAQRLLVSYIFGLIVAVRLR